MIECIINLQEKEKAGGKPGGGGGYYIHSTYKKG